MRACQHTFRAPTMVSSTRIRRPRRRGSRLKLALIMSATLVLLTLSGCRSFLVPDVPANASGRLVFGVAVSLSGSTEREGQQALEGYQLWADTVNGKGGLRIGNTFYHVDLKVYDDGSSTTHSAELTEKLITSDKVNFLLGPYGSAATLADAAVAEKYQVPMVDANGAASAIFNKGYHNVFGVLSPAPEYGNVILRAALSVATPPRTLAILFANDAFSQEVAAAARDYATAHHLSVVYFHQYAATADLPGLLNAVKTAGTDGAVPDMILGSGHNVESLLIMQRCRELGINPLLFAFTVGPTTPEFITGLGPDANYVVGSAQWTPQQQSQGTDEFGTSVRYAELFHKANGQDPAYQAAESTAAGLAFETALQRAGSVDPAKVRAALAALDIQTFFGRIHFDERGANTFRSMVAVQIQRGEVMTIYPQDVANAQIAYPSPPFGNR